MLPEDAVFRRKRFIPERMLSFGFTQTDDGYHLEREFLNGDFEALLTISKEGDLTGVVIDKMNGEDYRPLRLDRFQGAYVNTVRAAYEELLRDVAASCCREMLFASDQANRLADRIRAAYGVLPDYPWAASGDDDSGVFRHPDSAKWFALLMDLSYDTLQKDGDDRPVDVLNLKATPDDIPRLTARPGIYPAYHMNRKHWISVALDDRLTDDEVMALVEDSFCLTRT
ncbi:MAG: MmcQ/YjbR family DNA-binding protein [Clostridia bacterium]|nr:MmcQ/YjbR family DNA-binding protein [Clostridia bacterium]